MRKPTQAHTGPEAKNDPKSLDILRDAQAILRKHRTEVETVQRQLLDSYEGAEGAVKALVALAETPGMSVPEAFQDMVFFLMDKFYDHPTGWADLSPLDEPYGALAGWLETTLDEAEALTLTPPEVPEGICRACDHGRKIVEGEKVCRVCLCLGRTAEAPAPLPLPKKAVAMPAKAPAFVAKKGPRKLRTLVVVSTPKDGKSRMGYAATAAENYMLDPCFAARFQHSENMAKVDEGVEVKILHPALGLMEPEMSLPDDFETPAWSGTQKQEGVVTAAFTGAGYDSWKVHTDTKRVSNLALDLWKQERDRGNVVRGMYKFEVWPRSGEALLRQASQVGVSVQGGEKEAPKPVALSAEMPRKIGPFEPNPDSFYEAGKLAAEHLAKVTRFKAKDFGFNSGKRNKELRGLLYVKPDRNHPLDHAWRLKGWGGRYWLLPEKPTAADSLTHKAPAIQAGGESLPPFALEEQTPLQEARQLYTLAARGAEGVKEVAVIDKYLQVAEAEAETTGKIGPRGRQGLKFAAMQAYYLKYGSHGRPQVPSFDGKFRAAVAALAK